MAHDDFHREEAIKGPSNRSFGWTFTGVFLVVGAVRLALDHSHWQWWLAAGAAFAAVTLLRAELLAPLNRLWLKFGLLLHKVVNPLVMGVLFITTILPIGLALRALGKDPLRLRFEPDRDSYWIVRNPPGPAPETMRKQF
ncbi:MAG TPA: hypothetical protein VET85_16725 [Stellaceae bacterium]|nr:hypothetical protein [Stellaceae bacterium]